MNASRNSHPDLARSRLRAAVASMNDAMAESPEPLAKSWADLVELLSLGPEPELRACPVCNHLGMAKATLCGYCWTKLPPPTEGTDAVK